MSAGVFLNDILDNLALLIACVTLIIFTYRSGGGPDSQVRLAVRYAGLVALGLYLMVHSITVAPGLVFDFCTVVIALVARRSSSPPSSLPGPWSSTVWGPGAGPAVLQMVLVAVLGSWDRAGPGSAGRSRRSPWRAGSRGRCYCSPSPT